MQARRIAAVISRMAVKPSQRLPHMVDDPLHPHRRDQWIVDDGDKRAGRRETAAGKAEHGCVQRLPEPAMDEHEHRGRPCSRVRIEQVERRVRPGSVGDIEVMARRRAGLRRESQPPRHDIGQVCDRVQRELRVERGAVWVVTPEHRLISRGRRGCRHTIPAGRAQPAHDSSLARIWSVVTRSRSARMRATFWKNKVASQGSSWLNASKSGRERPRHSTGPSATMDAVRRVP